MAPWTVGIGGVTNGGKTSLANALRDALTREGRSVRLLCQDAFFKPVEEVEPLPEIGHQNWDIPSAIDWASFRSAVAAARSEDSVDLLLVEGFLLHMDPEVLSQMDAVWYVTLERAECERRRRGRTDYDPPDVPGYFEAAVWPAWEAQVAKARTLPQLRLLDGAAPFAANRAAVLVDARRGLGRDWIALSEAGISESEAVEFLREASCGAVSLFAGTTRDSEGQSTVTALQYQAYPSMAMRELGRVAESVRKDWPNVHRLVLVHRLGTVAAGETSVLVGVSSPHRPAAFAATAAAIDRLKAQVPVWKQEIYAGEKRPPAWKRNPECPWSSK